jgi:thiamine biosynthesis lipoprotein
MEMYRFGFSAMGSRCEIVLSSSRKREAHSIAALGIKEVRRIEYKYSRYRPDSLISRINESAGVDFVECDDETTSLFQYADTLYQTSGGLFDITSGVMRHAWDFSKAEVPSQESLFPLLKLIGWNRVERQGSAIRLPDSGMQIDFGGIGKEYAADRAATILQLKGGRYGYVNLGGDIRAIGPKPDGKPWSIGIQDPRNRGRMIASIPLYTGALATSGDYERFFEADGRRYCHIIHPGTGYPVNAWQSVTILAPLAITAGSCSTIAMLNEDEGLDFLENSGMRYLAIDRRGKIHHKD